MPTTLTHHPRHPCYHVHTQGCHPHYSQKHTAHATHASTNSTSFLQLIRFRLTYTFLFISKQSQASALKVASNFNVFRDQSYLMVAQCFDQVTYVWEECNNSQDLEWNRYLLISVYFRFNSYLYFYYNGKTFFSFNLLVLICSYHCC